MKTKNINPYKNIYKAGTWLLALFVFFLVGSLSNIVLLFSKKSQGNTNLEISVVAIVFFALLATVILAIMIWAGVALKITAKADDKRLKTKLTLTLVPILLIVWIFYFAVSLVSLKELEYKPIDQYVSKN